MSDDANRCEVCGLIGPHFCESFEQTVKCEVCGDPASVEHSIGLGHNVCSRKCRMVVGVNPDIYTEKEPVDG